MPASIEPSPTVTPDLRYRILGPLEALAGDRPLNLAGAGEPVEGN
jgi:hypothetical protein